MLNNDGANYFWRFFDNFIEYPSDDELLNGVPMDTVFEYVSTGYFNALVNHTSIKKVFLIQRYHFVEEHGEWETATANLIQKLQGQFHTDYRIAFDDVVAFAESNDSYWFFWADRDCSDSVVGRKAKGEALSLEYLIEDFMKYLNCEKLHAGEITGRYAELPLPQGWAKF